MGRNDYTGLLYAQPSLIGGVARTLDIGGTLDDYNDATSPADADQNALAADWYAIGADLLHVMTQIPAKTAGRIPHGRRTVRD